MWSILSVFDFNNRAVYQGEKQLHEVPEGTKRILQSMRSYSPSAWTTKDGE